MVFFFFVSFCGLLLFFEFPLLPFSLWESELVHLLLLLHEREMERKRGLVSDEQRVVLQLFGFFKRFGGK